MCNESHEDKCACPSHKFRTCVGFGFAALVIADGAASLIVGVGKIERKNDVEDNGEKEDDFDDFDDIVSAHEMAESTIPSTVVVAKNTQVGTSVEEDENEQKASQQCNTDFLCYGMNFG